MAGLGWEDVLEFVGTSGFTLGFDRLLRGELGTNFKKGFDELRAKIEERAKHQVVMWSYVRNNLNLEHSAPLIKIHRDARAAHQYMRANRIEVIYTLVYMTFEDVTVDPNAVEREQMREAAFKQLAVAARDNLTEFDDLLDSYERQGLRTYLLIAKQLGLDTWRFIGKPVTAIAEAIGGEGAVERLKMFFESPERWAPALLWYRNESPTNQAIREWMTQAGQRLCHLNDESRSRTSERVYWGIPTLVLWPIVFTGVVLIVSLIIGYLQK